MSILRSLINNQEVVNHRQDQLAVLNQALVEAWNGALCDDVNQLLVAEFETKNIATIWPLYMLNKHQIENNLPEVRALTKGIPEFEQCVVRFFVSQLEQAQWYTIEQNASIKVYIDKATRNQDLSHSRLTQQQ